MTKVYLTQEQLQKKIDKFPRIRMAHIPTPLEYMQNLTEYLGGCNIWVKREDMTGLAYAGSLLVYQGGLILGFV